MAEPDWCTKAQESPPASSSHVNFTCKTLYSRSGTEGIRTPDLRRAKAKKCILSRPGTSGNSIVLQVFFENVRGDLSAAYWHLPARLQYIRTSPIWSGRMFRGTSRPTSANPPVPFYADALME